MPLSVYCASSPSVACNSSHALDAYIRRAVELSDKSAGFTSPHPNFGSVIATPSDKVAGEGFLYAQGTKSVEAAGQLSRQATTYLNMKPGDCHDDHSAVSALIQGVVERVVIGIRHPLQHLMQQMLKKVEHTIHGNPYIHIDTTHLITTLEH